MKRFLLFALGLLWCMSANAHIADCVGPNVVWMKNMNLPVWFERTAHGKFVWCYVANPDKLTEKPGFRILVCKVGVCNTNTFSSVIDNARFQADDKGFYAALKAGADAAIGPNSPVCFTTDPTSGALTVHPWIKDANGNPIDYVDDDFKAVCAEALPFLLAEWPDAPGPVPPPTPTPTPPPADVFVVTKAASTASPAGTRPVYPWNGTTRGTTAVSGVRAREGKTCNCTGIATSNTMYCIPTGLEDLKGVALPDRTDVVTICEKK